MADHNSADLRAGWATRVKGVVAAADELPWRVNCFYLLPFLRAKGDVHERVRSLSQGTPPAPPHGLGRAGRRLREPGPPGGTRSGWVPLRPEGARRGRVLLSVGLVGVSYLWHQRVVRVGLAEQGADG